MSPLQEYLRRPPFITDPKVPLLYRGKVRETYDLGDYALMVATDNMSAFDVVMPTIIPDKGKVLTQMSIFWFDLLPRITDCQFQHHLHTANLAEYPAVLHPYLEVLDGRSMIVRKLNMLTVESIIRGYLAGSGWKEYQQSSTVCGIALPGGLRNSEQLPNVLWTPSTKAEGGDHDINISPAHAAQILGEDTANLVALVSTQLYQAAAQYALERGIIIADTKLEFGRNPITRQLALGDEVFTPDSSRFWPAGEYEPGRNQTSYDKQPVRDYLETLPWDKTYPGPELPRDIVDATTARYHEAYRLLTGRELAN